jgi:hypothetical protein
MFSRYLLPIDGPVRQPARLFIYWSGRNCNALMRRGNRVKKGRDVVTAKNTLAAALCGNLRGIQTKQLNLRRLASKMRS